MKRRVLFFTVLFIKIISAYAGPFGLSMGMTLEEVKEACDGKTPERIFSDEDRYYIYPKKSHSMFKKYIAWIDDDYGLYYIKAESEYISSNKYGEELKIQFYNFVEKLKKNYGTPEIIDRLIQNTIYKEDYYFWKTLQEGSREVSAKWIMGYTNVNNKDDLSYVYLYVQSNKKIILEYCFTNEVIVKEKEDSYL